MMKEETARKYYVTLQALKQQEEQLGTHLEELDGKTQELRNMMNAVEEIMGFADEDILVPVTNGVFMPAHAKKPKKLLLNVGSDTIVERTPAEAQELLQKQQDELITYREQLLTQRETLRESRIHVEQEIQRRLHDVQRTKG